MKKLVYFFLFSFLSSCSQSSFEEEQNFFIGIEDEHIGEYLQKIDSNRVITVIRKSTNKSRLGIVELNLKDGSWKRLVAKATEARDIKYDPEALVFREGQSLVIKEGSQIHRITAYPFEKIDQFINDSGEYYISGVLDSGESISLCWVSGEVVKAGFLPGRLLEVMEGPGGERLGVFSSSQDLQLARFRSCREGFESPRIAVAGSQSKYIQGDWNSSRLFFAYLDEELGTLNYALSTQGVSDLETGLINGAAFQSYIGMDMVLFEKNKTYPSILYMDGVSLGIRVSQYRNGSWLHFDPGIPGAVGFYSQILSRNSSELDIIFHAFRSVSSKGEVSFEDLQRRIIRLPKLSSSDKDN